MAVWNTIKYTEIRPDRFDAEFFQPLYKENLKTLTAGKNWQLGSLFSIIDRGEKADYQESGDIPVLRSVNIRDLAFNDQRQEYVTREYYDKKKKGQVYKEDILITSTGTGTLGRTSIWYKDEPAFNVPENSFLRNPIGVNPYFVAVFLSTKYGILQLFQNQRGSSGQLHLYPVDIRRIIIPEFLFDYQDEIGDALVGAFELEEQSKCLYNQAETLLAQELQLDQLTFPNKKWYTADYCEVVNEKRMNAEFFSPDVYYILSQDLLKESATINDVFEIIRGYTPKCYYQSGVPVVKTKNIRTPNIDKKRISDYADLQEPLTQTKENDLILAAMGVGSLGRMSYVTDEETNCAIDGTLRILRKKDLSLNDMEIPTMLFLSTEVGQKLIYRGISGTTGIISLPDDYLKRIPIPVIEKSVRRKVTELVLNSIKAKNQSEQLLAQAKQRVEELIEQEANKYKQV